MQAVDLDQTDRQILHLMQTEPGLNAAAIGERIGRSQSACWRRIQRLRASGVIEDRPVSLNRQKVGLDTMVFVQVKLTSHGRSNLNQFIEAVEEFPEVLDCHIVLGPVDFLLRIVAADMKAYERFFFDKLSQLPGVQEVTSSIVLSEVKRTSVLPL
ncbi:MAG: Lrp/AsnC family transcriptional regulator [Pseudomonadota bacterium]